MPWHKFVFTFLLAGIAVSPAFAQSTSAVPPSRSKASPAGRATVNEGLPGTTSPGSTVPPGTRPRRTTTTNPNRQEPCWQVAGVSKAAIQQRQALARQARQEIEAVCANSSLPIEQKRERIRQIRQQERQQVEALITPQQQEALRACQQSRGRHAGGGGHFGGGHGGGPCGTIPGFEGHEPETIP